MSNKVLLEDISLKEYSLDRLKSIKALRARHFQTKTEVCIERAKLMTDYYRANESKGKSAQLMRAEAVNYYLSNRLPLFPDYNLLAGGTSSRLLGAPVYPEFLGMTIWPELDTISTRPVNPQILSEEDAETLNFDVFPYWMDRTVMEVMRKNNNNPKCLQLMEKIVFYIGGKAGCISHCIPDYEIALSRGLKSIIAEASKKELELCNSPDTDDDKQQKIDFYKAVQIAMQGIINYAERLSKRASELAAKENNPEKKKNYETMAEICAHIPANPSRNYREAVNALWICQIAIHGENINMALSPGRLDQVLYPFYKKDVEENGLSLEEALTISCSLWLKIADNTNLAPETAEKLWGGAGSTPAVTLGGVDKNGNDAVNDLTYIFLKVTELMRLRDPSVNARYHYDMNEKRYRQRVSEVIVSTKAIPAFHNDVEDIKTLVNQGETLEDARDFGIVGCVELASTGKDYVASGSIMFNLAAAMEMALMNGKRKITGDEQIGPVTGDPSTFTSYEQFWEAFKAQLKFLLEQAMEMNNMFGIVHQQMLPTPLLSSFFHGPMDSGKDLIFGGALYNSSGASHLAFPDVCDSLNAIEYAIFQEKKMSMGEMVNAVKTNFAAPYDKFLPFLQNKIPRFGMDHPIALKNSKALAGFLYEVYQSHTNYRGGKYRPAYWTMTTHAGQGKLAGALPSGRRAGKVFSSGITPASQAAKNLTVAYNSIASVPGEYIPGGVAMNMKYSPLKAGELKEVYMQKFGDEVESYFRNGGLQVQFNIQTYEELIYAKDHPEEAPEMIVRVSGYSAYYKDLNPAMKDELISRTQYDLQTGVAVNLPTDFKEGEDA